MNKKLRKKQDKRKDAPQFRYARTFFTVALTLIFLSGVAVFAGKGGETLLAYLRPSVNVELSGTVSRDSGKVELSEAGNVKPGEVLEWKIKSENNGDASAKGYRALGQVPAGTEFVAGSAHGDKAPVVKYSIDGGQSFSEKPVISEKQADGSEKLVPAPASMYTQVSFEWGESLEAGKEFNAFYSTRVK